MTIEIGTVFRRAPHLMADLLELLLLTRYDGATSMAPADLDGVIERAATDSEEVDEELEPESVSNPAKLSEKKEQSLADIWNVLRFRDIRYKDAYPFDVSGERVIVHPNLNEAQRVYRLLLVASRLKSFPEVDGLRQKWAAAFTQLSSCALKAMLAPSIPVRIFDANSDDRRTHYGTNLQDAMKLLCEELHALPLCDPLVSETSGDGGVDLVAAFPFNDGATSTLGVLAQCAAQERNWPAKRFEGTPQSLGSIFGALNGVLSALFIPVCYRSSSGGWAQPLHTGGCLVLDRSRILAMLRAHPTNLASVLSLPAFLGFESEFQRVSMA